MFLRRMIFGVFSGFMKNCCSFHNAVRCALQVVVGDAAEWQMNESTWKFSNSTVLDVSPVGNTLRILQVVYERFHS